MQEVVAKFIIGFVVIVALVITIARGIEINGMSDIFAVILPEAAPVIICFFSDIPFTNKVTEVYAYFAQFFCQMIGKDIIVNITQEMGVTITIVLIVGCFEAWNCSKDRTAMKVLRRSEDEELKEKNFTERSEMFCKTLCQWLEEMNREANWNEDQFTPLEAEVEMDNGGKRKKKYEDLLKCLKNNRRRGTVYLVLGSPGSGKSVAMRKLCLDLLKESRKTRKIPVYINLKEWNEEWNLDHMPEKRDLEIFIRKTFEAKADFSTESFLNEYFQRMLDDGRWYFVFDSFDEMPCLMGKKNCQELIDGISALLYQFMTGANQSGGVVASRLYKAPSSAVGASVTLKIQEFSDIKIKTMLKKYLIHYEDVTKRLFGGREDLVTLCRNPFYLALLSNYISDRSSDRDTALPKNQMELYHSFIDGRLKKCAGKLEKENLSEGEIYKAAKELALFMQGKEECGLECPTVFFYQREDAVYWRNVFSILKYAKICRLGGQYETISFVHRRFQEFFLVESIIDQKQVIEYEHYRDILRDTGMRDALVLYCEVAEEEKVNEIADFCWKTIQENIKFAKNIHTKQGQELVCVLYFMKEAFRNRKQVLSDFNDDFYQLVKKIFDKTTTYKEKIHVDYVIALALVNTMVLFSNTQLKDFVLMVFRMNNRWLNDIIVQNCRTLDALGYHIENEFVKYFGRMDIRIFLRRFFDMQFSLSVSEKFKYVRKMHIVTMIINIACVLVMLSIGAFMIVNLFEYFLYRGIPQINILKNIVSLGDIKSDVKNIPFLAIILSFVFLIVVSISFIPIVRFFNFQGKIIATAVSISLLLHNSMRLQTIGKIEIAICILVILIALISVSIHDFKFCFSNRNFLKSALKSLVRRYMESVLYMVVFWGGLLIIANFAQKILVIVMLVATIVSFVGLFWFLVRCGLYYLKDCMWLRRHSVEIKHMQRTQLESNLKSIYFNRMKHKYLELLLLQNIELMGMWSDNIRPQYRDDRVNHVLAKLDCMKIDSCDYLF